MNTISGDSADGKRQKVKILPVPLHTEQEAERVKTQLKTVQDFGFSTWPEAINAWTDSWIASRLL